MSENSRTSWTAPNTGYEDALGAFVAGTLADRGFLDDLEAFVAPLVAPGRVTSLAQTLLKLTAPGVPDLYPGTELWDLSLVDPDNRRPVDYELRRRLLRTLNDLAPRRSSRGATRGSSSCGSSGRRWRFADAVQTPSGRADRIIRSRPPGGARRRILSV